MNCKISEQQQRRFGIQVAKDLLEITSRGEVFDLKGYMQSIYDQVKEATNDPERAVDYARLVPVFVEQFIPFNAEIKNALLDQNFDMNALGKLSRDVSNDENGFDAVSDFLELNVNLMNELGQANENLNQDPPVVDDDPPAPETSDDQPPTTRRTFSVVAQKINDFIKRKFYPTPPTAMADRIQEALSYNENDPNYNVPDPEQAFYFKVKRKIVDLLAAADYDSSQMNLDGRGPVFLTAMSASQLNDEDIRPPGEGRIDDKSAGEVVLVLTNENGFPFRFNSNGVVDDNGKIAYYYLRDVQRATDAAGNIKLTEQDRNSIEALAKDAQFKGNAAEKKAAAKEVFLREMQMIQEIRDYVAKNPAENRVQNVINGGTKGFIKFDWRFNTPIKNINFGDEIFSPNVEKQTDSTKDVIKGRTYFRVDSVYDQYIEIERPTINSTGLANKLASLILDDLVDQRGEPISFEERRAILDNFIYTNPEGIQMIPEEDSSEFVVLLKGEALDKENIDEARDQIISFFNQLGPAREIPFSKINRRSIVTSLQGAKQNQILEVTAEDGSKSYYTLDHQKLHLQKDLVNGSFQNFNIENGVLTETTEQYNDFLKDNFWIRYQLNKENKLVKLNAYFTFQPTQEALDEMEGTEALEEPVEQLEESTPPADPQPSSENNPIQRLDDAWDQDEEEFYKEIDAAENSLAATKEQIKEAKKWFEKHPIFGKNGKHPVPFKEMFNMINSKNPKAIAKWTISGITLYKGSDYSDLYHEAFHAFNQAFRTKEQQEKLYAEVRKKTGSFIDYRGRRQNFDTASPQQIEEYLAEDFRKYMLNGHKVAENSPERNSFFRMLLNILKALWEGTTVSGVVANDLANKNIREVYENLRVGNLNSFTFSQENVSFEALNKGIQAAPGGEVNGVQALSYENSKKIVDSIDSLFAEVIDLMNAGLSNSQIAQWGQKVVKHTAGKMTAQEEKDFLIEKESHKSKSTYKYTSQILTNPRLLKGLYKHAQIRFSQIYNQMAEDIADTTNPIEQEKIQKKMDVLYFTVNNFWKDGQIDTEALETADIYYTVNYHMNKSKQFFEQAVKLDFEDLSETESFVKGRDAIGDRTGNESSLEDLASEEIQYLIRSIHKVDAKGNPIYNEFGVTELIDAREIWNRLARALQNHPKANDMQDILRKEAASYPPFNQILQRLGPLKTGSKAENRMWTNFWQTFNLTRIPLIQMSVEAKKDQDGEVTRESRIGEASAEYRKIGRRWESSFHTADAKKSKYIKNDKKGNYLDIDAIIKDFDGKLLGNEFFFFRALGYKFSNVTEIKEALKKGYNQQSSEYYLSFLKYLRARGDIKVRNFSDLTKNYKAEVVNGREFDKRDGMNNRFKALQELEARYSNEHSNYMVTNAENNTQFEHSLNNSMTMMVNTINNSKSYRDLILSNPHMSFLDIKRNPFAKASAWLNSVYKLDVKEDHPEFGIRRKVSTDRDAAFVELKLSNLSGVRVQESEENADGIASAKADEFSKLIMDFHLVTQAGIPELMRHADKGTSFSVHLSHIQKRYGTSNQYIDNTDFVGNTTFYHKQAQQFLVPQIRAEVERILIMKKLSKEDLQNQDFKYMKNGQDFVQFHGVLSPDTKKALIKSAEENGVEETFDDVDIQNAIYEDTELYFDNLIQKAENRLSEAEFIADNHLQALKKSVKLKNGLTISKASAKDALVKSFVYNSWIHNIESMILYGDLAQFKDFFKRNAGAGSTGRIYRTDEDFKEFVNKVLGRKYADSIGAESKAFDGTFRTAVVKDNEIKSAYYEEYIDALVESGVSREDAESVLADYGEGKMNEADGQGFISFDAYRILKSAQGTWTDAQEALYNKIVSNEKVNPADVKEFFATVKAQYFGPLKTDTQVLDGLPVTAFHKFSLFPLIPSVIKNTNLQTLHDKMVREKVDYTTFESGSKVGVITKEGSADPLYKEGRNEISKEPFVANDIYLEYLKDQLEIGTKFKGQTIFPTQLRKLIEDGLYELGIPLSPKFEALIKEYEANIRKLTEIKKEELLAEVDGKIVEVDGQLTYEGDLSKLMDFVRNEMSRQDLADHEIDFIKVKNGQLQTDLSLSLSAEKIEKLINGLVTKRLVKQKVNGEALVQVASTLFESMGSTQGRNWKNPTDEEKQKYGSNDLPTYRAGKGPDGTTSAMKVKIALQGDFKHLLQAEDLEGNRIRTIERLNELIKDEEWLNTGRNRDMITMVGARIPVQGLNSMEFMEVYEFLPEEAGNIIVPPSEIVTKSGADYDIDKLTVMMPNIKKGNRKSPARMFNYTSEKELKDDYEKYKKWVVERERLKDSDGNKVDMRTLRVDRETGQRTESTAAYDKLLSSIFGFDITEIDKDLENILLKDGTLMSLEEFKLSKEGSKATENDLIKNVRDILALPENFPVLIRPNSIDIVKPLADQMAKYASKYDFTETVHGETLLDDDSNELDSPSSVFEIDRILHVHASNNIGKATLGLGAVDNTYNSVFNRIGMRLNASNSISRAAYKALLAKDRLTKSEQKIAKKYRRQVLLLPHNTIKDQNDEDVISLSHIMGKDGNRISDVINQMINGWVDIAKDPWIFNIQGNKEISPSLLFMIQAGVPIKTAVYFVSNPLIRQYVREQKLAKSTFSEALGKAPSSPMFYRNKAREQILMNPQYGFAFKEDRVLKGAMGKSVKQFAESVLNEETFDRDSFNDDALFESIDNFYEDEQGDIDYEYTELDHKVFMHFLEIEDMSKAVRDIKLNMNFDTSKSDNLFEAQNAILMKEQLKQDGRIPSDMVDKILNESPIGSFYIQPFQLAMWDNLFKVRNHEIINNFLMAKFRANNQSDVNSTYGDNQKFASEFRNDLMNFLFQNELRHFDPFDKTYSGYNVSSETDVVGVTSLKFGAFVNPQDGVLYVDKRQLAREFETKQFTRPEYVEKGLARVNSMAFSNVNEYIHFVYEREILRSQIEFDTIYQDFVLKSPDGSQKFNIYAAANPQKKNESDSAYQKRLQKGAYEEYIKDRALDNIFNPWKLFKSNDSYAEQFVRIRETYPELGEEFAIIDQLSVDGKTTGGVGVSFSTNLKLNNNSLDADSVNLFHENLLALRDRTVKKVADPMENARISDFFNKMTLIAFLQSGMNTSSALSLTRVVPQDNYVAIMEKPVKELVDHLESKLQKDYKKQNPLLEHYYQMFLRENSIRSRSKRIRGKDYLTDFNIKASEKVLRGGTYTDAVRTIPITYPLQSIGSGLKGFSGLDMTSARAKELVTQNPGRTYVYNFAIDNQNNATVADRNFYGTNAPNAVGMPTRLKYAGGASQEQIKDGPDGKIDPRVKAEIDAAIDVIKEQRDAGQELVFNTNGYGQYMIGGSDVTADQPQGEAPAMETFLYLSQQLFENFGFLNPNYLRTKPGRVVVQSSQPVSDEMVRDLINYCK